MYFRRKKPSRNLEKYPSPPISTHVSSRLGRLHQRSDYGGTWTRPREESGYLWRKELGHQLRLKPKIQLWLQLTWVERGKRSNLSRISAPFSHPSSSVLAGSRTSALLCLWSKPPPRSCSQWKSRDSWGAETSSACKWAQWGSPLSLRVPNPGQKSWWCPEGSRRADASFVLLIKLLE